MSNAGKRLIAAAEEALAIAEGHKAMTGKGMAMGDTEALGAAAMRAKAAEVVHGNELVGGRYREWPFFGAGNWSRDDQTVRLADAMGKAILALPLPAPADLLAAARELPEVANAISVMQMVLSAMKAADLHYHNTVLADALDAALRAIGGPT